MTSDQFRVHCDINDLDMNVEGTITKFANDNKMGGILDSKDSDQIW